MSEPKTPATDATQLALNRTVSESPVTEPGRPPADRGVLPIVERDVYVRGAPIASGGMGRISEARDTRLDRIVAIKELLEPHPQLAARFEREALITARLEHPAIVAVHEAGRWPNGEPFYAMKRVVGRAFDRVIAERKTIADRLALIPNVLAVFDALAYAHGKQIIHRDLKPANVLIGEHGETVVIDWGLAKDLDAPDDALPERGRDSAHTVVGAVLGTPAYMAPEQARGEVVDERADVYALGALLYYVLAGAAPYAGESAQTILAAVKQGGAPAVRRSGVPDDLATIVETAMARDPAQRYPTARELAEDLRRFQTGQLVGRHAYSPSELIGRWIRKHRVAVAVALAMLVVSGILLALAFRRIAEERDRAESDEEWERMQASQQRVARAKSLLDTDPASTLDVLRDLPFDAWEHVQRDAWLAAVATTGTIPAREVHLSPDGGYSATFVMADGSVIGLHALPAPPTEHVHAPFGVERFTGGASKQLGFELHDLDPVVTSDREWLTWREGAKLRAWNIHDVQPRGYDVATDTITAGEGGTVRVNGDAGCRVVELATAVVTPCPPAASVAFDPESHVLATVGVDGVHHTTVLPANIRDDNFLGAEPVLQIAPDGRAFVLGIGRFMDQVTVIGDIELAHVTTIPSQLLGARFVSNDHAFVVTRNGVLDVTPHAKNPVHVGSRGFELTAADITADARWAVVTGRHDVTLWDVRKFNPSRLSSTQPGEILGAAVASDGRSVVTFATDRSLRVWQLERGGPDRLPISGEPDAFAVIDDRAIITTQTATGHTLVAWSPGDLPVKVDVPHAASDDIIWGTTVGASPPVAARGHLVAVMMGAKLELVDLATATHAELDVDGYPTRLAFSPDGKQLLAVGAKLQIWDVVTHALTVAPGHLAAWLGDNRLVTADLHSVHVGATKLEIDQCAPTALAARGDKIVVGCRTGSLRELAGNTAARKLIPPPPFHQTPITAVAISEAGEVAAVGARPEVYLWRAAHEKDYPEVLFGETRAVTRLRWAGEVLQSATPSDAWIWDPAAANGGAKLPPGAKILLGTHHAFAANAEEHVVRATLLPPRLLVGFRAWIVARTR